MASSEHPFAHFIDIVAVELKPASFDIVATRRTVGSYLPDQIIVASSIIDRYEDSDFTACIAWQVDWNSHFAAEDSCPTWLKHSKKVSKVIAITIKDRDVAAMWEMSTIDFESIDPTPQPMAIEWFGAAFDSFTASEATFVFPFLLFVSTAGHEDGRKAWE